MFKITEQVNVYNCADCGKMRLDDFITAVSLLAVLLIAAFIRRKIKK